MKRMICILLAAIVTTFLGSCGTEPKIQRPVNFYYRTAETQFNTENGIIACETRESQGYAEDYAHLIRQYLGGATTKKCTSPFPAGTTLEALSVDNSKVQIVLSPQLALLSGSELMVACICLTRTVIEMTGATSVRISAKENLLDGKASITLTADSFVFSDMGSDYIRD